MKHLPLILPACVVLGAAIGLGCLPTLFRFLPNENAREQAILVALRDQRGDRPQVVVFGNSVAMNGFDGRVLRQQLAGHPVVWNLGTPGQSLIESLLIANQLPDSTKTVILSIQSHSFAQPEMQIHNDRMVACRLYGYKLTAAEAEEIKALAGEKAIAPFLAPYWKTVLDSRGIVKNSIDISVRSRLRKDLALEKLTSDLVYPYIYEKRVPERVLQQLMARLHKPRSAAEGVVSDVVEEFILNFNRRLTANKRTLVVVIPPEHPHQIEITQQGYYESLLNELNELADSSGFQAIDLTRILSKEEFIDQVHPSAAGARKASSRLASLLNARAVAN